MIIRTTAHRLQFIDQCVAVNERLAAEMRAERWWNGRSKRSKYDVRTSYLAWEMARELMIRKVFNQRGAAELGMFARGAIQDVVRAMNAYDRHPAFHKTGAVGHHARTFPAWRVSENGGEAFFPRPTPNGEFVMLTPEWHGGYGRGTDKYTLWMPNGDMKLVDREDRLAHQLTHEALLETR